MIGMVSSVQHAKAGSSHVIICHCIDNYKSMKRVLLRDFIFDRLYHPTEGYFCRPDFQLGEMKQPLDFKNMIGFDDYQKELQRNYPQNAWLTPSEIFKPYYGMTVANYIMNAHRRYE